MDDMVVKSHNMAQHVADLEEVLRGIRKYDMHLCSMPQAVFPKLPSCKSLNWQEGW